MKCKKLLAYMTIAMLVVSNPVSVLAEPLEPNALDTATSLQVLEATQNEEKLKEGIEAINKLLAETKPNENESIDECKKRLSAEVAKIVNENEFLAKELPNLTDLIDKYWVEDAEAKKFVTKIADLQARSVSAASHTDLQNKDGAPIDPDDATVGAEGSAEGGYYADKDSYLTDKELAYRSHEDNQKVFKDKLDYVQPKLESYLSDYNSLYNMASKKPNSEEIGSNHKPIINFASDGTNTVIGVGDKEYETFYNMARIELAGLEEYALLNPLLKEGSSYKSDAETMYKAFKESSQALFGKTIEDSTKIVSVVDLKDPLIKYKCIDSNAILSNGRDEDLYHEVLQTGLSVFEVFAWKYKNLIDDGNKNLNHIDLSTSDGDDSVKKAKEETNSRNKKGLEEISNYVSDSEFIEDANDFAGNTMYYNNILTLVKNINRSVYSRSTREYKSFSNISQYAYLTYLLDSYEDEILKMPIITNSYCVNTNLTDDGTPYNMFLQLESALRGALNIEAMLSSRGLADAADVTNSEDFITFLNANIEGYCKVYMTAHALGNFYKVMGYNTRAKNLKDYADNQYKAMTELITSIGSDKLNVPNGPDYNVGDNILPEKEVTVDNADSEENQQADNVALDKLKETEEYYELIAWTASFTPFETRITDAASNSQYLSEGAQELYAQYLGKMSPVYAVEGDKGTISALNYGNSRNLSYITLRDFLTRQPDEDIVLFANKLTEEEIFKAKTEGIIISQVHDETSGETQTKVNNQVDSSCRTDNIDKFIGPIYISSNDESYAKNSNKLDEMAKKEAKNNKDVVTDPTINNDMKNDQTDLVNSVQTQGTSVVAQLTSEVSVSQYYMNYVLMYNTLKNGAQNTSGLEPDMDRPLFVDFLGNIVTESGYVVVPTAANATYYRDVQNAFPIYTAMFLNAYPSLTVGSDDNIVMTGADEGKYLFCVYPDKTNRDKLADGSDTSGANLSETTWKKGQFKQCYVKLLNGQKGKGAGIEQRLLAPLPHFEFALKFTDTTDPLSKVPSDEEGSTVSFVDIGCSFEEMGPAYLKQGAKAKNTAKAFSMAYYEKVNVDIDGVGTTVGLNAVSAKSTDPSWKANLTLVKDHYLNNKVQNGAGTSGILKLDSHLIKIAKTVASSSRDTDAMLLDETFINYEEKLKDNPIISYMGNIYEKLVGKIYGSLPVNLMLYTPTMDNTSFLQDAYLYVKPLTYIAIVLLLTIAIFGVILQKFGNGASSTLADIVISCTLIIALFLYNLNLHPTVTRFVYEEIPNRLMNNQIYDYIAYGMERKYKTDKTDFFNEMPDGTGKVPMNTPMIKLKEFTDEEALAIRKSASGESRLEVNSEFYSSKYDNQLLNIVGSDVYLKGNGLYITVEDLFDKSAITDMINVDHSFTMNHELYDGAENIGYFTPYYNILESLVYTVNTFSEGCDAQVKLKNYKSTTMTSGRGASYFRSIFFISPDNIDAIRERTRENYLSNLDTLSNFTHNDDMSSVELEEFYNKQLQQYDEIDSNIDLAYAYLLEGMGDMEDWLGLEKVLYLDESARAPFLEDRRQITALSDWFPSDVREFALRNYPLEMLDENGDDVPVNRLNPTQLEAERERIRFKIKMVNQEVKSYILNDLADVADCFSDDTLLKIVALKATLTFDKEFSDMFGKQIYPRIIEVEGLDNRYTLMTSYLSRKDIFNSASDGLAYILAYKEGWGVLVLGMIDALLRVIAFSIPIIAIAGLTLLPFLMVIFYILRKQRWVQYMYSGLVMVLLLSMLRYVNVGIYVLTYHFANHTNIVATMCVSIIGSIVSIILARVTVEVVKNSIKYSLRAFREGLSQKLRDFATGGFGGVDGYSRRDRYDTDTYYRESHYRTSHRDYNRYARNSYHDDYYDENSRYDNNDWYNDL